FRVGLRRGQRRTLGQLALSDQIATIRCPRPNAKETDVTHLVALRLQKWTVETRAARICPGPCFAPRRRCRTLLPKRLGENAGRLPLVWRACSLARPAGTLPGSPVAAILPLARASEVTSPCLHASVLTNSSRIFARASACGTVGRFRSSSSRFKSWQPCWNIRAN